MKRIYVAELFTKSGDRRVHNGRPSRKWLYLHPEYVRYVETGCENEYIYTTEYKIDGAKLIEVSDREKHVRNFY